MTPKTHSILKALNMKVSLSLYIPLGQEILRRVAAAESVLYGSQMLGAVIVLHSWYCSRVQCWGKVLG